MLNMDQETIYNKQAQQLENNHLAQNHTVMKQDGGHDLEPMPPNEEAYAQQINENQCYNPSQ